MDAVCPPLSSCHGQYSQHGSRLPAALSRGQVVSGFGLIRFLIGPVVFVEMS